LTTLRVVAAAILLMGGVTSARADDAGPIVPGTRLRVFARTRGDKPLAGVLQSFQDDELILTADGDASAVVVPRQEVMRIDRSGGRHSRGRWAFRGAGLGLLAGIALGLARGDTCTGQFVDIITLGTCTARGKAAVGAIVGIPAGALIGLSVPPGERWEHIPLDRVRSTETHRREPHSIVSVSISF